MQIYFEEIGYHISGGWELSLSNCDHCDWHPRKLMNRDFWTSRNNRNPLSQQKCVLRKCCGVSQKQSMLELSNLCHCVQHPWKLTSRDFWSSRNERKSLSQQKCVLRKCCGVPQKWWMLELPHLCHCVQDLWKLTSRFFGALGMTGSHFLSRNVSWENAVGGISEMVNARALKPVPLCSAPLKTS